jgi:hypothetical protein
MIKIEQGLPGQRLTYSQRRRLLNLLWALASNSALPFILGIIVAVITITHEVTETIAAIDKTGLGYCVYPESKDSGSNSSELESQKDV